MKQIWNFEGECLRTLSGHRGGVTCLNFNGGEKLAVLQVLILGSGQVFSGSLDGDLRFWDLETGKVLI